MPALSPRHRRTVLPTLGVLCIIAIVAACGRGTDAERVTPGTPFDNPLTATPAQWRAYLATLRFDNTELSTDSVAFTSPSGNSVVHFTSERGVRRLSDAAVVRGRVIARAVRTGEPGLYDAPVGTAYIWVDSLESGWRWLWVTDSGIVGSARAMVRGSMRFAASSNSGMYAVRDTFPNGRCGDRCCLFFESFGRIADTAHVRALFEAVHASR